jgi:hypothetical protein
MQNCGFSSPSQTFQERKAKVKRFFFFFFLSVWQKKKGKKDETQAKRAHSIGARQ